MDKCWDCAYKESIPGNAHIKCAFDWSKAKTKMPECDSAHGRRWFSFPINFDPCWGDECKEFSTEKDKKKTRKQGNMEGLMTHFC